MTPIPLRLLVSYQATVRPVPLGGGLSRASVLYALSRPPLTHLPASPGSLSQPLMMAAFTCARVAVGAYANASAATPATKGVESLVRVVKPYALPTAVLRMFTPGAARSTLVKP